MKMSIISPVLGLCLAIAFVGCQKNKNKTASPKTQSNGESLDANPDRYHPVETPEYESEDFAYPESKGSPKCQYGCDEYDPSQSNDDDKGSDRKPVPDREYPDYGEEDKPYDPPPEGPDHYDPPKPYDPPKNEPEPYHPPKQENPTPRVNACDQAVNHNVIIGGYRGTMTTSRGILDIALLGPGRMGSFFTSFPHDNQQYGYGGGKIQNGQTEYGTFLVSGPVGQEWVQLRMDNSREVVDVGYILDSNPGGSYPREAKLIPADGACVTQYVTDRGELFSGGNGYLVVP